MEITGYRMVDGLSGIQKRRSLNEKVNLFTVYGYGVV
jgi:hypothetical protein